jgi:hypothetical protein
MTHCVRESGSLLPKIAYEEKHFTHSSVIVIKRANSILEDYARRDVPIILTLRQLYYQFVARGWIANEQKQYKRLGNIINDARMAGSIDWGHLQDRTRNLSRLSHWDDRAASSRAPRHPTIATSGRGRSVTSRS